MSEERKNVWMRSFFGALALGGFGYVLLTLLISENNTVNLKSLNSHIANAGTDQVVVVELFTSEGCSSCPPADRVLSQLAGNPPDGIRLIALSEHVDYWNYLGWRDPYSLAYHTRRQRLLAHRTGQGSLYTPQAVVNGRYELVGSAAQPLTNTIREASISGPLTHLGVTAEPDPKGWRVRSTAGWAGADTLRAVWVQRMGQQQVPRGENHGKNLSHVQIVRSWQVLKPTPSGIVVVTDAPAALRQEAADQLELVLLAEKADGTLLAAGRWARPKAL